MDSFHTAPNTQLTGQIIGAAQEVHRTLGQGLNEKCYENALCIELSCRDIMFAQQKQFPVTYKAKRVGTFIPDLIVDDTVIVETKTVDSFCDEHIGQVLNYLHITGLTTALLINFKPKSLKVKRVSK